MVEEKRTRRKPETDEERGKCRGLFDIYEDMKESIKSIFPPEFMEHISNAGRENLLAIRSIIDNVVKKIDRELKRSGQQ